MIDAAITWVDGKDPLHKEKRIKYDQINNDETLLESAKHPSRFADNNEIWYCIHSIRRYAPYVDKIFLVTDAQQPKWLTEELKKTLNIHLIDHKIIFQGYEQYLPTFNSIAIESMLYRIPGISNNFIFFSDDIFLISPTKESDFFDQDHLICRGEWLWKIKMKRRMARLLPLNDTNRLKWICEGFFLGFGNEESFFKKNRRWLFALAHTPYVMKKNICEEIFKSQGILEAQIKYRFRNKMQYIPAVLVANLAMSKGIARKGPLDFAYLACTNWLPLEETRKWLDLINKSSFIKCIAIQSLDLAMPEVEREFISFLQRRLDI